MTVGRNYHKLVRIVWRGEDPPMQEPWTRVIGNEADCDIITLRADRYYVPLDGIGVIICTTSGTYNDRKCVLCGVKNQH